MTRFISYNLKEPIIIEVDPPDFAATPADLLLVAEALRKSVECHCILEEFVMLGADASRASLSRYSVNLPRNGTVEVVAKVEYERPGGGKGEVRMRAVFRAVRRSVTLMYIGTYPLEEGSRLWLAADAIAPQFVSGASLEEAVEALKRELQHLEPSDVHRDEEGMIVVRVKGFEMKYAIA